MSVVLHHFAKFRVDQSYLCWDMAIFCFFFKMAAVCHLEFVMCTFGPPSTSIWLYLSLCKIWLNWCSDFNNMQVLLCLCSLLWRCWLGGRKGIWPVKNWVVRYWRGYLSGARCKWFMICMWPSWCHCHPTSLAPVKSRIVYLSGASLPRLSWKKAVKQT